MKIIVSACLLGENCKYNGTNNKNENITALADSFDLIPVCPECFGGLATPRPPAEILNGRVINKEGVDVSDAFYDGAEKTLYVARECNAPVAVLKSRSPSCGCGMIYDGSFSGKLISGNGITAELLLENDIQVFSENNTEKLRELYGC